MTLAGQLGATSAAARGHGQRPYLPIPTDASNSWIKLFQKINEQYNNNAPFDGNILYGMAVGYRTCRRCRPPARI